MIRIVSCAGLVAVCLAVAGCNGSAKPQVSRYPVSGKVTLDGQPIADGQIYFKTIATGMFEDIPVKDGAFQGLAEAGSRRVEVLAFREAKPSAEAVKMYGDRAQEMMGNSRENYVPAKYNTESQLTAEVKPTGTNEFTFELQSK